MSLKINLKYSHLPGLLLSWLWYSCLRALPSCFILLAVTLTVDVPGSNAICFSLDKWRFLSVYQTYNYYNFLFYFTSRFYLFILRYATLVRIFQFISFTFIDNSVLKKMSSKTENKHHQYLLLSWRLLIFNFMSSRISRR